MFPGYLEGVKGARKACSPSGTIPQILGPPSGLRPFGSYSGGNHGGREGNHGGRGGNHGGLPLQLVQRYRFLRPTERAAQSGGQPRGDGGQPRGVAPTEEGMQEAQRQPCLGEGEGAMPRRHLAGGGRQDAGGPGPAGADLGLGVGDGQWNCSIPSDDRSPRWAVQEAASSGEIQARYPSVQPVSSAWVSC